MRPFREETLKETGKKHRTPWDLERANAKLQEFNREEIAIACRLDVQRAIAAGLDVAGERLSTLVDGPNGTMVVDPIASKIHHSGASVRDAVTARWRKFCSEPQNDEGMEYPMPDYVPKEARKLGRKSLDVMTVSQDTEKRRPGRPRKSEMAAI